MEIAKTEKRDKESIFKEKLEELFDEYYLNKFQRAMVMTFIKKHMGDHKTSEFTHARSWLLNKINKIQSFSTEGQKGCPDIIPGLRASPFWYLRFSLN
jgi:hypothetical protein